MHRRALLCLVAAATVAATGLPAAQARIVPASERTETAVSRTADGSVTVLRNTAGPRARTAATVVTNAKSRMPLLRSDAALLAPSGSLLRPSGTPGAFGADAGVAPAAYGTNRHPYDTSRVANISIGAKSGVLDNHPTSGRPYSTAGKLWMGFGAGSGYNFICSASLIGRGLLVTAAHCISRYGQGAESFAQRIAFVPAANSNSVGGLTGGPYGTWVFDLALVPTAYLNGTDSCWASAPGVVCANDIAVILLRPRSGVLPFGPIKGFFGYGWNGYSYTPGPALITNATVAQITQLGYPGAIDQGAKMIRNDSMGVFYQPQANVLNQVIGSAMTGGSSGGPWLVNFGRGAVYGAGSSFGSAAARNIVVGTTSWGYVSLDPKQQGASWFGQNLQFPGASYTGGGVNYGAGNIGALVKAACFDFGGKAAGKCQTAS
jgi:hypothetical protein